jgi:hypothetical protein
MKHTLTVACIFLKSAWQAVCRHFQDQNFVGYLRCATARSALTALLLAPLAGLHTFAWSGFPRSLCEQ